MNRIPTVLLSLSLALAVLTGGLIWYVSDHFVSSEGSPTASAMVLGGPFKLIDQDGAVRTDRDFHGKFVLLYFGYSFCPDVCPTTLGVMSDALSKLDGKAQRIVPVFVTVDPERDTPAALKKYLAAFGPRFMGLTGTVPQVKKMAHEYGVYFAKHPIEGGGYGVDHSSVVYLLGPDGKLVTFYDEQMTPDTLAKDLATRT